MLSAPANGIHVVHRKRLNSSVSPSLPAPLHRLGEDVHPVVAIGSKLAGERKLHPFAHTNDGDNDH